MSSAAALSVLPRSELPADCHVTVRCAGTMRRRKLGREATRVPLPSGSHMEQSAKLASVDLLQRTGEAYFNFHYVTPGQAEGVVVVSGEHSCGIKAQLQGVGEVRYDADPVTRDRQEYIAHSRVEEHLHLAMQALVQWQPEDPYLFLARFLGSLAGSATAGASCDAVLCDEDEDDGFYGWLQDAEASLVLNEEDALDSWLQEEKPSLLESVPEEESACPPTFVGPAGNSIEVDLGLPKKQDDLDSWFEDGKQSCAAQNSGTGPFDNASVSDASTADDSVDESPLGMEFCAASSTQVEQDSQAVVQVPVEEHKLHGIQELAVLEPLDASEAVAQKLMPQLAGMESSDIEPAVARAMPAKHSFALDAASTVSGTAMELLTATRVIAAEPVSKEPVNTEPIPRIPQSDPATVTVTVTVHESETLLLPLEPPPGPEMYRTEPSTVMEVRDAASGLQSASRIWNLQASVGTWLMQRWYSEHEEHSVDLAPQMPDRIELEPALHLLEEPINTEVALVSDAVAPLNSARSGLNQSANSSDYQAELAAGALHAMVQAEVAAEALGALLRSLSPSDQPSSMAETAAADAIVIAEPSPELPKQKPKQQLVIEESKVGTPSSEAPATARDWNLQPSVGTWLAMRQWCGDEDPSYLEPVICPVVVAAVAAHESGDKSSGDPGIAAQVDGLRAKVADGLARAFAAGTLLPSMHTAVTTLKSLEDASAYHEFGPDTAQRPLPTSSLAADWAQLVDQSTPWNLSSSVGTWLMPLTRRDRDQSQEVAAVYRSPQNQSLEHGQLRADAAASYLKQRPLNRDITANALQGDDQGVLREGSNAQMPSSSAQMCSNGTFSSTLASKAARKQDAKTKGASQHSRRRQEAEARPPAPEEQQMPPPPRTPTLFASWQARVQSVDSLLQPENRGMHWHGVALTMVAKRAFVALAKKSSTTSSSITGAISFTLKGFGYRPSVGTWLARPVAGPQQTKILEQMTSTVEMPSRHAGSNLHKPSWALHVAAYKGDVEAVQVLLMARADPDAADERRIVPLHLAAEGPHDAVVAQLIRARGTPDVATFGSSPDTELITPLHAASWRGATAIAFHLLTARASPGPARGDGVTPLHFVAQGGFDSTCHTLLAAGAALAPVSMGGFTPLHDAADGGHALIVGALLAARAPADVAAAGGATPLHSAAQRGHMEVIKHLLAYGAPVQVRSAGDFTPLHDAAHSGHLSAVHELLRAGAVVGATTADGATALHFAAQAGHAEVTAALLSANASVDVPSSRAMPSPLHLAARCGHAAVVRLLRQARQAQAPPAAAGSSQMPAAAAKCAGASGVRRGAFVNWSSN